MASGRPRQPNDPSIMASVETAMSTVARPGLIARTWHWRYELGLIAGLVLGTVGIGITLGPGWLIAVAAATMAILAAALIWPPSRQRIIARAWCVITPHRVRTGCAHAWIQTRDGRLPVVLYTVPAQRDAFDLLDPMREHIEFDCIQTPIIMQTLIGFDMRRIHVEIRSDCAANRCVRGISHGALLAVPTRTRTLRFLTGTSRSIRRRRLRTQRRP